MKSKLLALAVLSAGFVSGCAMKYPQTADEFRAAVPTASMATIEKFEVNRPFDAVAATFKKMAPRCLDKVVTTESRGQGHYSRVVTTYRPTVLVTRDRAELHLQSSHKGNVHTPGRLPEGGYYVMVVDARPAGPGKTAIELYRPKMILKTTVAAVKGWASGDNVGCPDLTK